MTDQEFQKKRQQKNIIVNELKYEIQTTIDKLAKNSGYEITYAEINSALSQILKSNIDYELREEIDKYSI